MPFDVEKVPPIHAILDFENIFIEWDAAADAVAFAPQLIL